MYIILIVIKDVFPSSNVLVHFMSIFLYKYRLDKFITEALFFKLDTLSVINTCLFSSKGFFISFVFDRTELTDYLLTVNINKYLQHSASFFFVFFTHSTECKHLHRHTNVYTSTA